jgi:hypothetical protein
MTRAASRRVAIWIDHHEAILLAFEVGPFASSVPHRPGDGWSQHRVDGQQYPLMQQYYDAVLSHLEPQDEILILGPGQAKRELRQRIEQHGGLRGKVVGLYHASRLADAELIFPTSQVSPSEAIAAAAMAPKGKLKAGFRGT